MRTRTQRQQRRGGGGDREKERMRASDAKYEMYSKGEGGKNLMEPKNIDTIDMICMVNSHVKLLTHSTENYYMMQFCH